MRFAYAYFIEDAGDTIPTTVPAHVAHWQGLSLQRYEGGPFADRKGGLVVFDAASETEAEQAVAADPFVREHLVRASWLKRWLVE